MKRIVEVISNIWKVEDLRKRIMFTLMVLLVYRLGSYIQIPGIELNIDTSAQQGSNTLVNLINIFSGGAFTRASVFALGIMPYISASIVVQLMGIAVPSVQRLQREGESGRRKINQIIRYLTIIILIFQSVGYLSYLRLQLAGSPGVQYSDPGTVLFVVTLVASLTAGSMFVLWLGERITERGLGNGVSLIIMIGIIAGLPGALFQEIQIRLQEFGKGYILLLVEMVLMFLVFMVSILLVQGTRKIPIQYAKRVVGNKQYGGARQYLPLKVNAAGVMPIIFAQAIMMVPIYIASAMETQPAWMNYGSWGYNLILAAMVIIFTYFYTAITIQPHQIAEDLKRNGGFIPGVKPGKPTAQFIDSTLSRITLPGSFFLAFVTILPSFAVYFGISSSFAQFFGGTSLLILVGVVLDTLQHIESALLMRHYDGLMKTGRIKGRTQGASV